MMDGRRLSFYSPVRHKSASSSSQLYFTSVLYVGFGELFKQADVSVKLSNVRITLYWLPSIALAAGADRESPAMLLLKCKRKFLSLYSI